MKNRDRIKAEDIKAGDWVLFEYSFGVVRSTALSLKKVFRVTQRYIFFEQYRFTKNLDERFKYIGWLQEGYRTHKIYSIYNPDMVERHKNEALDIVIRRYRDNLSSKLRFISDYNTLEEIGKIITKLENEVKNA